MAALAPPEPGTACDCGLEPGRFGRECITTAVILKMQSCNITKLVFYFLRFFVFFSLSKMLCEAVENNTVSQVSLKSKFSGYFGCPGPTSAFTYFYLFNPNQPLPQALLFLEGERMGQRWD